MIGILDYAKLSDAAYSVAPTFGDESTASRAVLSSTPDGVSVGFPGTDNPECLVTDLDAVLHDAGPLGKVHRGVFLALDELWKDLAGVAPSTVYGHSLGGALALLYAARLCLSGSAPKSVYAFEPPKLSADAKIRGILADYGVMVCITRNGNDVIPTLPAIPFVGWQHPADILRIGNASMALPNIEDHLIHNVIASIAIYQGVK